MVSSWINVACWICGRAANRRARSDSARFAAQQRLHEARHLGHQQRVLLVSLRVDLRVAPQLAHRASVVVDPPEVVALGAAGRGQGAVHGQQPQSVACQLELADDLGPQQADHVRRDTELESGNDLLGDRCATEHGAALQDEHAPAGSRQVRRTGEAVVSAADDDRVVWLALRHVSDGCCRTRRASATPTHRRRSTTRAACRPRRRAG